MSGTESEPLSGPYAVAERIASKDLNNLYLTSRYFADPERYRAFCALYAVMRVVDDRVDNLPSRRGLSDEVRAREHRVVSAWRQLLLRRCRDEDVSTKLRSSLEHPEGVELVEAAAETMHRFPLPLVLWRNFFEAMERDIERPRFTSYQEFLDYSEGATVAPTTIYLYLIASQPEPDEGGRYLIPSGFDLISCGRHLGLFAYLAHILRDLEVDLNTGEEGLLYLAKDDMDRFGVSEARLFADAERGRTGEPVKALLRELADRARRLKSKGDTLLAALEGRLTPDCAFILELIVTIYERILSKIADHDFDVFGGSHRLTMPEKAAIAREVKCRMRMDESVLGS